MKDEMELVRESENDRWFRKLVSLRVSFIDVS